MVLALGGASWSRLGSDGAWVPWLQQRGVALAPLRPANCGFEYGASRGGAGWSEHFASRFAGQPLKSVAIELPTRSGTTWRQAGEFVVTHYGVEGSLIYAASARCATRSRPTAVPRCTSTCCRRAALDWVAAELARPRGSRGRLSTHLKTRLGLHGVKAGLLHELLDKATLADAAAPGRGDQGPAAAPARAASDRRGHQQRRRRVLRGAWTRALMLKPLPGVFCAGEMLDWEAPTGGYLLSACFASGRVAGQGALDWLARRGTA